jgi:DNA repair exonuclease SbcCD nuclease subunit
MLRALLLGDTHLGFDYPFKPRIRRRRRGDDFFRNFRLAIKPALEGKVDLVVHGGDLFTRSRVPEALAECAMAPLKQAADTGIPVFLVPGNHERSKIPLHLWSLHPNLFIFREPRTFRFEVAGMSVALSGFPFVRKVGDKFVDLVQSTGYEHQQADVRLLCLHQAVEGARVGPVDYTFKGGPDVIRGCDIPGGFAALLSGHIHRAQRLIRGLSGEAFAAPVIYPGSVERTAFAERFESKGFLLLEFSPNNHGGRLERVEFVKLPARPMVVLELDSYKHETGKLLEQLRSRLADLNPDSVVRIRIKDDGSSRLREQLTASYLRKLTPETMNVSVAYNRKR